MQDIRASSRLEKTLEQPIAPLLYTLSTMHCGAVSLAQGGAGLGTMWGEELALEMLRKAGFGAVDVHRLEHDQHLTDRMAGVPGHPRLLSGSAALCPTHPFAVLITLTARLNIPQFSVRISDQPMAQAQQWQCFW